MSLMEIVRHIDRLNQRVAEARAAGDELWRMRIEQEIEPSLGAVVVDAGGDLLEVRLHRTGLRVANPRTVGQRVIAAIYAAEARAASVRDEHVRRWSHG